jgi:hypothetical protein
MEMNLVSDFKEVLKSAINNGEVIDLLEGNRNYYYEDKLCGGPTDPALVIRAIYNMYIDDRKVKDIFVATLNEMLEGTIYDNYFALLYFMYHVSFKNDEEASFDIDIEKFVGRFNEVLNLKKNKFVNVHEFNNKQLKNNMWDMILNMCDSLEEYDVYILN